jgi:hypothetical protein
VKFSVGAMLRIISKSSNAGKTLAVALSQYELKDKLHKIFQEEKTFNVICDIAMPFSPIVLKNGLVIFPGNGVLAEVFLEKEDDFGLKKH